MIYLTGSRGGLGSAIKQKLERDTPLLEVTCLDRPEYDMDFSLYKFIKNDFNVYINCSHNGFAQVDILYELVEANKDRYCHIINVGSVASDGDRMKVHPYCVHKAALEKACQQLALVNSKCKVSLIKPGRMNTKMVEHIDAPKMRPEDVANAVVWMINQPREINIKSLTIDIMQDLT